VNTKLTVLDSLNTALHQAFAADARIYLLGEDILDPYGGAFKITRGLSTAFPQRVLTTPISEAGIVGLGTGMALRGLRPVVEIMFGDFLTLAADQLINHAAKFRWMYNDQVHVPLVIRTPMGGRRGYGPTHSQTLEKFFLGTPGLQVLAPAALSGPDNAGSPGNMLYHAILDCSDPTLFVENKLLYLLPVQNPSDLHEFSFTLIPYPLSLHPYFSSSRDAEDDPERSLIAPTFILSIRGAPISSLTLVAYGYMADLARQAALRLAYEHEIFVDLIVPTCLSPLDIEPVVTSTRYTGRLLVVEEGTLTLGWGAEVLACTTEVLGSYPLTLRRLAARDLPIPSSGPLESTVLPGVEDIITSALSMFKSHV
jgi:pyruvate/2-oxoglutarate/acetoin dehydrogenase E1 component